MKSKHKKIPLRKFNSKPHFGNDRNTVYVSNLSYLRDQVGIKDLFRPYGEIVHIKVVLDKKTNKPTGMAFVEMKNAAQADEAIWSLNGQEVDGRTLKAAPAIPMRKTPSNKAKDTGSKKTEGQEKKYEKPSKDSMEAKQAKAKRRKGSGLDRLNQFLSKKNK